VTVKVADGKLSSLRSALTSCCSLAALLMVVGAGSPSTARAETRTISLHHVHTKESLTVTYRRNGLYDEEALSKINHLLRDWREQEPIKMDPHLIDLLWEVHREVGAKEPISIICGYRSEETNTMLRRRSNGVAKFSQHMAGRAIDFFIPGVALTDIQAAGLRAQRGGVGIYPSSHFVHMDTGSVRHWPRMPEAQLAKVMAKGPLGSRGTSDTGRQVALASATGKPGFLARLFGLGKEEDEDAETAAALAAPAKGTAVARAAPPRAEAAIPLPQARPVKNEARFQIAAADSRPNARARLLPSPASPRAEAIAAGSEAPETEHAGSAQGTFQLASATSTMVWPSQSASAGKREGVSANDVINERGFWRGLPSAETLDEEQAAAIRPPTSAPVKRTVAVAALGPATAASATPWPLADRTAGEPLPSTLAYAAQPTPIAAARPLPMGAGTSRPATPGATSVAAKGGSDQPSAAQPPKGTSVVRVGDRFNEPWTRAMIVSPSAETFMRTSLFGIPDFRNLRMFMLKPAWTVTMTFSEDPHHGMTTHAFAGSAVTFIMTSSFGARTAALR
jgi:uncharacterized protein YcbK (DUF882 family)